MTVPGGFPARGLWRRPALRWPDLVVVAALLALLFGLLRLAPALNAPFLPKTAPSEVSTDAAHLPYYAVRSLLRMFIALVLSLLFTFVYATAAARLRRVEKVLIPVLDILQSVPVLGFLSVTVTAFINLFPGSELGLECASVFAIFTSMAWNMTFNTLFDRLERRAGLTRTLGMRVAHAVAFELGLVAMVVPVAAWWLNVSLVEALVLDLGLVLFFLPYTFCFNLAYDALRARWVARRVAMQAG